MKIIYNTLPHIKKMNLNKINLSFFKNYKYITILLYKMVLKISIVGPPNGGKTTFIQRFIDGGFIKRYKATFGVLEHSIKHEFEGKLHDLIVYDHSGQSVLRGSDYTIPDVFMVMYDGTSYNSNKEATEIISDIQKRFPKIPIIVGINKIDSRMFKRPQKRDGLQTFILSAKANYNFEKPFNYILKHHN